MHTEVSVLGKVMKGLADLSFYIRLMNENYDNFYIQTQIIRLLCLQLRSLQALCN